MPTSNERRALWFLAIVALSGTVVRMVRARSPDLATPDAQIDRQLARVDSARTRNPKSERKKPDARKSPLDPARKPIDLDLASASEIESLPGIGPALADRIVAFRDSAGTFGSISALCRVRGVGPATAKRLRETVVFSGAPDRSGACEDGSRATSKSHVTNRRKAR